MSELDSIYKAIDVLIDLETDNVSDSVSVGKVIDILNSRVTELLENDWLLIIRDIKQWLNITLCVV